MKLDYVTFRTDLIVDGEAAASTSMMVSMRELRLAQCNVASLSIERTYAELGHWIADKSDGELLEQAAINKNLRAEMRKQRAAEIASLRDRLAKAEETIAGYERRSYGWPTDDPENTYADAEDYASECELEHGVTFDWEVAAVIRTERYRVVEHRDEEGNWTDTTAELVTDSANPLPEATP